jgi:hypothetical protein
LSSGLSCSSSDLFCSSSSLFCSSSGQSYSSSSLSCPFFQTISLVLQPILLALLLILPVL